MHEDGGKRNIYSELIPLHVHAERQHHAVTTAAKSIQKLSQVFCRAASGGIISDCSLAAVTSTRQSVVSP